MDRGTQSRPARRLFFPGVLGVVAVLSAMLSAVGFAVLVGPADSTPEHQSKFTSKYRNVRGSKLESCKTCHSGDTGNAQNVNVYGKDFAAANHDFAAVEGKDSDGDGFSNIDEINAKTYPGDPSDNANTQPKEPPKPAPTTTTTRPFPFSLLPDNLL